MRNSFPPLEQLPEFPEDVLLALDVTTSRPRIWDEYGVPLDSYYSKEHHPTRDPADYAYMHSSANFAPNIIQSKDGHGLNVGLMDYIRPHVPEMLHLAIDGVRAFRTVEGIPANRDLSIDEALTVSIGLNSLWALLMYRTNHRVANGELPVHVANLHRTFVGYEGVFDHVQEKVLPKLGAGVAGLPPVLLEQIVDNGLTGKISRERCPASRKTITQGMTILLSPGETVRNILGSVLERCESPRLLADLQVDDLVFIYFSHLVRQVAMDEDPEGVIKIRELLEHA